MKLIRTTGRNAREAAEDTRRPGTTRRRGAGRGAARGRAHRRRCAQARRSRTAALRGKVRRACRPGGAPRDARRNGMRRGRRSIPRFAMRLPRPQSRFAVLLGGRCRNRGPNRIAARPDDGPACAPAQFCWVLCAQRSASAAFHAADDGDSGTGGGREADRRRLAQARARNAGRGALARDQRVLSARRRARHRGAGLRNREPCRASTRLSGREIST